MGKRKLNGKSLGPYAAEDLRFLKKGTSRENATEIRFQSYHFRQNKSIE